MNKRSWLWFGMGVLFGGLLVGLAWLVIEYGWGRPPKMVDCQAIDVEVVEVLWDGWPSLQMENQFNREPAESERILLLRVRVDYVAERTAGDLMVDTADFRLRGSREEVYAPFNSQTRCGVVPDALEATLEPGQWAEGNVCFRIPWDEEAFVLFAEPGECDVTASLPLGDPEF